MRVIEDALCTLPKLIMYDPLESGLCVETASVYKSALPIIPEALPVVLPGCLLPYTASVVSRNGCGV